MTVFDEATAVRRLAEGRYAVRPDERFALVAPGGSAPPAVNGGVLMATMLRAVLDGSPHPHPVATSAHFLRVPLLAPAQVEVQWLRRGNTAATARAALIQDARTVLDLTVTTGTLPPAPPWPPAQAMTARDAAAEPPAARGDQLTWTADPPKVPPIEECVSLGPWPGSVAPDGTAGYAGQVDLRLDPATTGWRRGNPAGIPEMRGYFRLREDRDPDAYLLALAVDGLPPVMFGLGATGWAPTVELTWFMRAVPVPGPLQVSTRSRHVSGGWFDEEAEVWDASGRLVAQSHQMARVGRGRLKGQP
jgi:Thioesterase-like superfamily